MTQISNTNMPTQARLDTLKKIIEQVADYCLTQFSNPNSLSIENKAELDFVSNADNNAELMARKLLHQAFPNDIVVGEEFGGETAERFWIIDPIDGTANFINGLPLWAVSIAYIVDDVPMLGAIALPALNTIIWGGSGLGVQSKGDYSSNPLPSCSLFSIGRNQHWHSKNTGEIQLFLEDEGFNTVSLGSCVTSMAFVILKRLSGYVEANTNLWDCAAGIALCEELSINTFFSVEKNSLKTTVICGNLNTNQMHEMKSLLQTSNTH